MRIAELEVGLELKSELVVVAAQESGGALETLQRTMVAIWLVAGAGEGEAGFVGCSPWYLNDSLMFLNCPWYLNVRCLKMVSGTKKIIFL